MERVYNFSAGPSMMPLEVLEQAQREMLCYPGAGCSVMEMSHRSPAFEAIITEAEAVLRRGPRLCAVTLGAEGALLAAGEKRVRVPAEPGPVVDTTGAGDAFWGGLLTRFLQKDLDASPKPLNEAALTDLARFAAHEAAKCVAHRGAF